MRFRAFNDLQLLTCLNSKAKTHCVRLCPLSARLNRRLPPDCRKVRCTLRTALNIFCFFVGGGWAGVYRCRHCLVGTGPYSLQTQRTPEVEPRIMALGFRLGGAIQGFGPYPEVRVKEPFFGRTHTYMGPHMNFLTLPVFRRLPTCWTLRLLCPWQPGESLDCTLLGSTVCIHKISGSA